VREPHASLRWGWCARVGGRGGDGRRRCRGVLGRDSGAATAWDRRRCRCRNSGPRRGRLVTVDAQRPPSLPLPKPLVCPTGGVPFWALLRRARNGTLLEQSLRGRRGRIGTRLEQLQCGNLGQGLESAGLACSVSALDAAWQRRRQLLAPWGLAARPCPAGVTALPTVGAACPVWV